MYANHDKSTTFPPSFDYLHNNCHVFIFDVLALLKVPYNSYPMKNQLVEYATMSIMQNDEAKTNILNSIKSDYGHKSTIYFLRGEKAIVRKAVVKVIEDHYHSLPKEIAEKY